MDRDRKRKVGSGKARMTKKKNWKMMRPNVQSRCSHLKVEAYSKGSVVMMMTQVTFFMQDSFLGYIRHKIINALYGNATCKTRCCLL